jgi:hypothetical protein
MHHCQIWCIPQIPLLGLLYFQMYRVIHQPKSNNIEIVLFLTEKQTHGQKESLMPVKTLFRNRVHENSETFPF